MPEGKDPDTFNIEEITPEKSGVLRFQNSKQRQIRAALIALDAKMGKRIAAIYEGILIANAGTSNPERHAHVAHSIRELTAVLPQYVVGLPQTDKAPKLTEIISAPAWKEFCEWFEQSPAQEPPAHLVEFVAKISNSVGDGGRHKKQLEQVLDLHPSRNALPAYQRTAFAKKWSDNNSWFIKHSHHAAVHNAGEVSEINEAEFQGRVETNDELLYQALVKPPFFEALPEIDALLAISNPSAQDVDKLVLLTAHEEQIRYFFERCKNDWLDPLNKKGAFSAPRPPRRTDGYIQFLPWPESGFLARAAGEKPKEVHRIIKGLTTDNQSVHNDFVSAALASPPKIAAEYVKLIEKGNWLDNPYRTRVSSRVADLLEKLARDGQPQAALQLAYTLFDVKPSRAYGFGDEKMDSLVDRSEAKGLYDDWEFGELLEKKTSDLAAALPTEFFQLLIRKLSKANEIEGRDSEKTDEFYDYSHIWRPTLTKPRRHQEDVKNLLLDRVLDLIGRYKDDPATLAKFADIICAEKAGIFKRIELHLYYTAPRHFAAQIESVLRDSRYMVSHTLRKEFVLLLRQNFVSLPAAAKEVLLQTIDAGHPLIKVRNEWTQQRIDMVQNDWKSTYLIPIKEHLPSALAVKYASLIKKDWSEEDLMAEGEFQTWSGSSSAPATTDDIEKMEPTAVVELMLSFVPPADDFTSSSVSGLAQSFQQVVSKKPTDYVRMADTFIAKKLRPKYIYHFLQGIKTAVQDGASFAWDEVVGLCHDAVLGDSAALVAAEEDEQDWDSVRKVIADVLGDALGHKTGNPPIDLRESVWAILEKLSNDPDPTPEDEKGREGNLDPMSLSINTVRGEAMHAIVNYGMWCARHGVLASDGSRMPPEVRAVFDLHLDLTAEPSLAVRSVYGWRLPNISYLSLDWLKLNVDQIFPEDEAMRTFFAAAMQGVMANTVYQELVDVLSRKYFAAIDLLHHVEKKGYQSLDLGVRLPHHLMVVYVRDAGPKDVIEYFFKNAPPKARAEAISYLGRQTLEEINVLPNPAATKTQLVDLWTARIAAAGGEADVEELKQFAWWFRADVLDKKACINLLIETLKKTGGRIEAPYRIFEALPGWVGDFPEEAVDVLTLLAHGKQQGYRTDYYEHRDLIVSIKKSGVGGAVKKVDELIQYLGEQGYVGLGDILKL